MGTISPEGCELRSLVLRKTCSDSRLLYSHTDIRSAKVEQIKQTPRTLWHFYHPALKVQLRITGTTSVHTDDEVAQSIWDESSPNNLLIYLAPETPGTFSQEPFTNLPVEISGKILTSEDVEPGRANFAVTATQIERLDWMKLHPQGNLRALYTWDDDGFTANWIAP